MKAARPGAAPGLSAPWALAPERVARELGVDPRAGLSEVEAARRLRAGGPNLLREVRPPSALRVLAAQLRGPIVALLAGAALVAASFGEWLDAGAIAAVLAINAAIGFATELRAVRSVHALRALGSVRTRVRRGGGVREVPATDVVTGDVLVLEAGDVVTADARVATSSKLELDESALTGESVPVAKDAAPAPAEAVLAERTSLVFKGTAVTRGSAEALVCATGMATELGRIARLVQEAEKETTPLEARLAVLGRRLVAACVVLAAAAAVAGWAAGEPLVRMVETGVALAVAAIPEGLPIVATIALARGMRRMARRHALVNRLSAVETLGETDVVFVDKTGTLTENRLEVLRIELAGGPVEVERGPSPFRRAGSSVAPDHPALRALLEAAVLCNNAELAQAGGVGDPLEVALLEAGRLAGLARADLLRALPEVREEAFDPRARTMATVHRAPDGHRAAVKGAAEPVLAACAAVIDEEGREVPLDGAGRAAWAARAEELAADGLRVLAVARRDAPRADVSVREGLTLLGLLGLADPPRADVAEVLSVCRAAGVRVAMVTGDHARTAAAIARAIGLTDEPEPAVVPGTRLERLDELPQAERDALLGAAVYARVAPEQKLALIAAAQRAGHVVAMTGDGVNDAPALRKADIGVAMGLRGTQVARESADMVLVDDRLASIVAAVEQGRIIFDNIRKFVLYLFSCNTSEVLVVSIAALVGLPLPLLPLQILFLNLVTDVFPALALAQGEGDGAVLRRPPRPRAEPILARADWVQVVAFGLAIAASTLGALAVARHALGYGEAEAVTVSFLTLAFAQLWHVFDVRAPGTRVLRNDVAANPWVWGALALCAALLLAAVHVPFLARVLHAVPPGPEGWVVVLAASLVPFVLGQAWLALRGRRPERAPARAGA